MANPSDLVPSQLKPAWTDGSDLKRALTRSGYSGGTPSSAADLKPSLLNPDGTLKESLLAGGSLKSSLTGSSGGSFDAEALDYFARAEALGGNFDRTAVNPTYTESYVKTAISNFIAGCKTDLVWDKITECYLLAGTSFDGLMAKLKYDTVSLLSNTNFVSGDYVAAGSGAGLKGNGQNKRLGTGVNMSDVNRLEGHLSIYMTETDTGNNAVFGALGTGGPGLAEIAIQQFWNFSRSGWSSNDTQPALADGMTVISRRASNDYEVYQNGVSTFTETFNRVEPTADGEFEIFSRTGGNSHSASRATIATLGGGLTDTEAANLSTRVNALMIALGTAVYGVVSNVQANGVNVTADGTQVTVTS